MRMIGIFVSSPADVQRERAIAEQSIRSVAAEFNLPINVSYSNPLRGSKEKDEVSVEREDFGDESTLVLCPCFWEYPELEGDDFLEQIPNTGQYDLVICILWSRLGNALVQKCVMPDGSQPRSATEYEVAWALDQSKLTPGFPGLHVYRNRATPAAPLEPKEKREDLCRQWDAVQEFCAAWEKNRGTEFRDCCHDYQDLEEFENLFREHFRDFLARHLDREIGSGKALGNVRYLESNPFRGLNFFDFEHAALYHGRTKAVWEVLDALQNQATAKKRFVLVLGPTGSGKSSLVRAGVLPLLTRGETPVGNGPWRRAVTRPGAGGVAGDPFDTLAAALLGKFALPELQDEQSPDERQNLASRLRKDPDDAAARIAKVLDQLTRQELDHLEIEGLPASSSVEVVGQKSLGPAKPKMHLAVVVDQLEELFTGGVSPVLQRKYISALDALAHCERVFIIATLRSDFYADCQQFPELVELTAFGGKYDLQPPTPRGIGNMIRSPAAATGLRFEQDPDTNRSLDQALVDAAIASPEPLPLLEHLLSRLYQRQLDRKDGLLRWSDYRGLGELQDALAQHAETVFLTLKPHEQQALKFVIRHLVAPSRGEEGLLSRRTVPYRDLVSSPRYWDTGKRFGGLNRRQRAGAKGLVDRLIKEGLLSADTDPKQELLISVPQEALLRKWPGVWQWLAKNQHFFRMRDRLDASVQSWLNGGRHKDDLLDRGIGLAEAETLLRDFGSSLSEGQIDYIQKSLARQKRRRSVRDNIGLAAVAGLAVFAAIAVVERFSPQSRRKNRQQNVQPAQQNADLAYSQRSALETELKKAQDEKAQTAQQNANLISQSGALETQLKKAEEKAQVAQQNADLVNSQRIPLETELKKAREEKTQLAQQNANLTSQSGALETQLKKAEEKAQVTQQNTDLANSQLSALETELKKTQEEKAQLAQQNANLTSQSSALGTQLKKVEEEEQIAQQNTDLANSQRSALETELKKAREEKAQLAQQNADLATSQRNALETQLKKAEEKAQLAQQNADVATSQQSALETQLKNEQLKLQQVQVMADRAANQLSELEAQLRQEQERAQKAQANADFATSELRGMRLRQRSVDRVTIPLRAVKVQPAMNDQNSESKIGAHATFAWFTIGVNPEEKQDRLQWGKYARLNPPQDVSPIPSPSNKEPDTSNAPESQFDRSAQASGEEEFLKEFVLGYLRTVASNDTSVQRRYFAKQVNFYGRGLLDSSNIEASTQHYHDEWPIREWTPRGEAKVVRLSNPNLFVVYQPFSWTVSDGSRNAHGNATLYLRIRKNSQGEFRIVHVHQLDR
jgi:conflict system STAND superfamily ATPase